MPARCHGRTSRRDLRRQSLADGEIEFVPFASLFGGNPYEAVNPPNPDGGFFSQDEVWSGERLMSKEMNAQTNHATC